MSTYNDDYLDVSAYSGEADAEGFYKFSHEGKFYFSFSEEGNVVLCSEGYQSESGRDNGVESVKKNMNDEEKYATVQLPDGKWALSLKAGNRQEIARSGVFSSEAEAKALTPSGRAEAKAAKLAAISSQNNSANNQSDANGVDDDYMICREYEEQYQADACVDGFVKFFHSTTRKYYFAWYNSEGSVIMRSEGYTTESARDNGVASVQKNSELDKNFSTVESKGAHFLVLKAGNGQEIARSCPKKTAEEALGLIHTKSSSASSKDAAAAGLLGAGALGATNLNSDSSNSNEDTFSSTTNLKSSSETGDKTAANFASADLSGGTEAGGGFKWWWLLLPLLLMLAFYLWKCNTFSNNKCETLKTELATNNSGLDSVGMAAQAEWEKNLGAMTQFVLPSGDTIMVPSNGDEKKLCEFLHGECQGNVKETWFNMDRILFNTGQSTLHEASNHQLDNITKIFKSFPNSTYKIGGYTDNVGDSMANMKLSASRAAAVLQAIKERGIDSTRLRSEGYGPQHPVCPENNTDECKAKNRRCAIRVDKCK